MIKILPESSGNVIGIRVDGNLTTEDYKALTPRVEQAIDEWGSARLVMLMGDLEGMSPGAIWEDLKFDAKHFREFTRIAVVGDKKWHGHLATVSKPFVCGDVRHFATEDAGAAWNWANEAAPGAQGRAAAPG